jgi:N-acetylmuramoyl-L-alanine amidase
MKDRAGMRAANITRVKRRVLREAVAENVEVIRGMPPRGLRPLNRALGIWLHRLPYLAVILTLAGSAYMMKPPAPSIPSSQVVATKAQLVTQPIVLPALASSTTTSIERVTAAAFPLAVRRVVLDAGHGGTDPGASAPNLLEKEITLDIGRRLRTLLEHEGFEVIVTRETDHTLALRDRARLANESKSDIFVSIHVNALAKHVESRGIETYYLGATSDPTLTQLAAAENSVSGYSLADMRRLLDGVYADARRDESHQLATVVQQCLYKNLRKTDSGLKNWGVKRAPFIVLVATDMPAILAEVGCISNEKEAAMLRTPEYRQAIAEALLEGIRGYAGANVEQPNVEKRTEAPVKKGNEQNG